MRSDINETIETNTNTHTCHKPIKGNEGIREEDHDQNDSISKMSSDSRIISYGIA